MFISFIQYKSFIDVFGIGFKEQDDKKLSSSVLRGDFFLTRPKSV